MQPIFDNIILFLKLNIYIPYVIVRSKIKKGDENNDFLKLMQSKNLLKIMK